MNEQFLFFIKLPDPGGLCHAVVKVVETKNKFHTQAIKCRQLISSCNEVVASPHLDDMLLLDVVMQVEFYRSKFGVVCKCLHLTPQHASITKDYMIERCLMYTIKFRLECSWVQVGSLLLNDPNFLTSHKKINSISLNISVCKTEMTVQLQPYQIHLPPPSLECFQICSETLQRFHDKSDFVISQFFINLSWCRILPTMKQGQIVEISKKLPKQDENQFKDYKAMCKYWKCQYGYQLPRDESAVIYCSIHLQSLSANLFTYPLVCLRSKKVQFMPRCDKMEVVKQFMHTMHSKINKVCGTSLKYSRQAYIPTLCLTTSLKAEENRRCNVAVGEFNWLKETEDHEVPKVIKCTNNEDHLPSQQVPSSDVIKPIRPPRTTCDKSLLNKFKINAAGKYIPSFMSSNSKKKNLPIVTEKRCNKSLTKKRKFQSIDSKQTLKDEHQSGFSGEMVKYSGSSKKFYQNFVPASQSVNSCSFKEGEKKQLCKPNTNQCIQQAQSSDTALKQIAIPEPGPSKKIKISRPVHSKGKSNLFDQLFRSAAK